MTLVDTSVWVDHLRNGSARLGELLVAERVLMHPFVLGELACGNLRSRALILAQLDALPSVPSAEHQLVLRLVEDRRLWGKGLGWIDAHLLTAALVERCGLWTLDKALARSAGELKVLSA